MEGFGTNAEVGKIHPLGVSCFLLSKKLEPHSGCFAPMLNLRQNREQHLTLDFFLPCLTTELQAYPLLPAMAAEYA